MASVLDRPRQDEQFPDDDGPPPMWARRDLKSRLITYFRRALSIFLVVLATCAGGVSARWWRTTRARRCRWARSGCRCPPATAARSTCTSRWWTGAPGSRRSARRSASGSTCRRSIGAWRRGSPRASRSTSSKVRAEAERSAHHLPHAADRADGRSPAPRSACWSRSRSAAGSRACAGRRPRRSSSRSGSASRWRCSSRPAARSPTRSTTPTARTSRARWRRSRRRSARRACSIRSSTRSSSASRAW